MIRYALRTLRRSPGSLAAAWIATLVWLVGATVAIHALSALAGEALPFPGADRIVSITGPYRLAEPLRADPLFEKVAKVDVARALVHHDGTSRSSVVARVDRGYFRLLGLDEQEQALEGARSFGAAALVSESLAHSLGFDPRAATAVRVRVGKAEFSVVGTVPRRLGFPVGVELWSEDESLDLRDRTFLGDSDSIRYGAFLARLTRGASIAAAQERMDVLGARLERESGTRGGSFRVETLGHALRRWDQKAVRLLEAWLAGLLAFFVLALGFTVAGFWLDRERDLAIHVVQGADRRAIIGLAAGHLAAAALPGLVLGGPLALLSSGVGERLVPFELRALLGDDGGLRALGIALALWGAAALAVAAAVGAAGIRGSAGGPLLGRRHAGVRRGAGAMRLRTALVVVFVALTGSLLWISSLLGRSLERVAAQELGFEPASVEIAVVRVERDDTTAEELLTSFGEPPALSTGISSRIPLGSGASTSVWYDGPDDSEGTLLRRVEAAGDLFATMGIPILAGTGMLDRPAPDGSTPCVLDAGAARYFFAGRSPLGARLSSDMGDCTVVGVVGSIRELALERAPGPAVYLPLAAAGESLGPRAVAVFRRLPAGALREAAAREDRVSTAHGWTIQERTLLTRTVALASARRRLLTELVALSTLCALLLAGSAIHGLFRWRSVRRRREFAIRYALGDTPRGVGRRLAGEMARLALLSGLVAVPISIPLALAARAFLFEVEPTSPAVALVALAALVATALLGGAANLLSTVREVGDDVRRMKALSSH